MPEVSIHLSDKQIKQIESAFKNKTRLDLDLTSENWKHGGQNKLYLFPLKKSTKELMLAKLVNKPYKLQLDHDEMLGSGIWSSIFSTAKTIIPKVIPHLIDPFIGTAMAIHSAQQGGHISDVGKYIQSSLPLSEGQKLKLKSALEKDESIRIRLTSEQLKSTGEGTFVFLTKTQETRLKKCQYKGVGCELDLSRAQLKVLKNRGGGVLSAPRETYQQYALKNGIYVK
jgi:hypothetical protein